MTTIKKIAVLGTGLMGHGIAQLASQMGKFEVSIYSRTTLRKGYEMILRDLNALENKNQITEIEKKEILSRIHLASDQREAVLDADLVFESIPERIEEKRALFKSIDKYISSNVIIASGTSSINITALACSLSHPENFCGMHFFNPPQLMKLVEVVRGKETSDNTIQTVSDVAHRLGKETVLVSGDSPGFIVNRILIPALNQAAIMCSDGVADRDDIDKAFKLGLNWPMGPLMLIDYIGADTVLAISRVLENELPDSFKASKSLEQLVNANLLGRKTGKGFYEWPKK